MSVSTGTVALATAYNSLRTSVNQWFGDPNSSMVFGDGSQSFGWGGTMTPITAVGTLITADSLTAYFNSLIDRCNIGIDVVNNVSGAVTQVVPATLISAVEYNNTETISVAVNTNRLDIEAAELALNAGGTVVQSSTWSTLLRIVVRYTFADFAHARYFFNSGGGLNISMNLAGGTTGNALSWANLFTDIGTITMNYGETIQSGSGGTPAGIGFYNLSAVYQQIYTANPTGSGGSYASYSSAYGYGYSDNDIIINARRSAAGDYVELQIICDDTHVGSVDGTTTLTTQYRKLIDQTSGAASLVVTAPAYSLIEHISS